MPTIYGNSYSDALEGTSQADVMYGYGSVDMMAGGAGDDQMHGGAGADFVDGQSGADRLYGNAGDDLLIGGGGGDVLVGDAIALTTTSESEILPSTGQEISISMTAPDAAAGGRISVSGLIGNAAGVSSNLNIAIVVDVSGSTSDIVQGLTVGDQNNNGSSNEIIDAEIAAVEALIDSIINDLGAPNANIGLIAFDDSAGVVTTVRASTDADGNNVYDVVDSARGLTANGGTHFDDGLTSAINFFNGRSGESNYVYFMSDGAHNGGSYTDEVDTLTDPAGINAVIRAYGVGANSSRSDLDNIDSTGAAVIVDDLSDLSTAFISPPINPADINRVQILVNGDVAVTLQPDELTVTPLGLKYDVDLTGLKTDDDDAITARVIMDDADSTRISTRQIVEHLDTENSGADVLIGGDGADEISGNGGNDLLDGGAGADTMDGGSGADRMNGAQGADIMTGGAGADRMYGASQNDTLTGGGGEDSLFGGTGDDTLTGGAQSDRLRGGQDNDVLNGGKGADNLGGGLGDDRMTGGRGADTFVFHEDNGDDVITDFSARQNDVLMLNGFDPGFGFNNLTIVQDGSDAVVDYGSGTIRLEDVDAVDVDTDYFVFG